MCFSENELADERLLRNHGGAAVAFVSDGQRRTWPFRVRPDVRGRSSPVTGTSGGSSRTRWDSGRGHTAAGTLSAVAGDVRGSLVPVSHDERSVDPRSEISDCGCAATNRAGRRSPGLAESSDPHAGGGTNPDGGVAAISSKPQSATGVDGVVSGSATPGFDRAAPMCGGRMGSETRPFRRQRLSNLGPGTPFFERRPDSLDPVLNGLFVALAGLTFGFLHRKTQ